MTITLEENYESIFAWRCGKADPFAAARHLLPLEGQFWRGAPLLEPEFHVLCVSYDGFDETQPETTFPTMLEETEKIEAYINSRCGGHIHAAYGCSLGGSFVGLLATRQNIRLDIGILGSSDRDQSAPWKAELMTNLLLPLIYPVVRDGRFRWDFLNRRMEKRRKKMPDYVDKFMEMMGGARPYVSLQSCKNQFYSDLVAPLPDHWNGPTAIHVFYARRMGEQYRARYYQHFAHPVLHEQDLQYEELLSCYPEQWAQLVKEICLK